MRDGILQNDDVLLENYVTGFSILLSGWFCWNVRPARQGHGEEDHPSCGLTLMLFSIFLF